MNPGLRPHRIAHPRRIVAALTRDGWGSDRRSMWVVECARRTSTHDVTQSERRMARHQIAKAVRGARVVRIVARNGGIAYSWQVPAHLHRKTYSGRDER